MAYMESLKARFVYISGKLDALSPLKILSRGYSITRKKDDGGIVKLISDVEKGDRVEINVSNGLISCIVNGVEGEKGG